MKSVLQGQTQLDLFATEPTKQKTVEERCCEWQRECHGFQDDDIEAVRVLFRCGSFSDLEADERSKSLQIIYGKRKLDGWVEGDQYTYLDILNTDIGYHTLWDRKWAAIQGIPKEQIPDIQEWDYRKGVPIWNTTRK